MKLLNFIINIINIFNIIFFTDLSNFLHMVEETKFQKFLKKLKFCFNHLLIHPFIDLTIIGISYRIIYFLLKITGFL